MKKYYFTVKPFKGSETFNFIVKDEPSVISVLKEFFKLPYSDISIILDSVSSEDKNFKCLFFNDSFTFKIVMHCDDFKIKCNNGFIKNTYNKTDYNEITFYHNNEFNLCEVEEND